MADVTPTFTGEVQFRRYSDTSTQGVQIVLALHDREALDPLVSKTGKRFMAVLVEIGDDEQPVQAAPRKDTRGPLCREACDLCAMPEFQEWAYRVHPQHAGPGGEAGAKATVLAVCQVTSRKELDASDAAAGRFVRLIRLPFMRHMKQMNSPTAAKPH